MADKPVTREEKYLAYLTGDYMGELPKPITRKEKYLYELCLKGMGGEISPEEIKNAVNEYLEKNPVKPGATTEQAQQIEQNKTDIGSLKTETGSLKGDLSNSKKSIEELNDKKITKFYASNLGETNLSDSDKGKIQDMMLYGKSIQDGTPTPDNPVEIQNVVNPKVKVCGGNLLQPTLQTTTLHGVTCTNNGDGTYTLNGTTNENVSLLIKNYNFEKGINYKLVGTDKANGSNAFLFIQSKGADNGNGLIYESTDYSNIVIGIYITNGSVCNNLLFKPMLTTDLNATYDDYEPYKGEQTATLPYTLNAIPVSEGGNVTIDGQQYITDYVDIERKKLVRMVWKDSLKDKAFTPLDSINGFYFGFEKTPLGINGYGEDGLCTHFINLRDIYSSETGITFCWGSSFMYISNVTTDVLNSIKEISYVIYPLATPTEIDLTDEEVQAFKELATYYPTTNVIVTSDQLDGFTTFNYPLSMANGWNLIKEQLGDTREYIYDMELQSAEAYVNSEYAVALTELGV